MAIDIEAKIDKAMAVVRDTNQSQENLYGDLVPDAFRRSLAANGIIELVQFTCPPVKASYLRTSTPELYISNDVAQNNFETGGRGNRLQRKVFRRLSGENVTSKLMLIIGDDDEEQFIFPVLGKPSLDSVEVEERKRRYDRGLSERIQANYPDIPFTTFRTSLLTQFAEQIQPFDERRALDDPAIQNALEVEVAQLVEVFQTGGYYEGYPLPRNPDLRAIAERKFLTYARQGQVLREWFPNGVLVMNEFPLTVRARMINLANDQLGTPYPIIYPYQERTKRS